MKTAPRHPNAGIALVIVMITIAVFSILVAKFAFQMKVETKLAQNANSEMELYLLGRSGVEYCRWVLAQGCPNEPYDSLNQRWAGGPGGLCTNDALGSIEDTVYLGNGSFTWKIEDLERKVNVNIANDETIEQALRLIGVDASEYSTIAGAIQDWVDPDEATHISGAESDYYQGLNPPYFSKNAPVDDLIELLLVKGIAEAPEIYWGGYVSKHRFGSIQRRFGHFGKGGFQSEELSYPVGLKDLFTPLSSGKININTASLIQLQMIPFVDETVAAEIVRIRAGPDGADGTEDDTPFQNAGELVNVGLNNQVIGQMVRMCDVRSRTFEVKVEADIAGYKHHYVAVLGRSSAQDIQVLTFYREPESDLKQERQ